MASSRLDGAEILNSSAVADGVWQDGDRLAWPASFVVSGFTGLDRAQIRVSNSLTKPVNTDHAVQSGTDISVDTERQLPGPYRWFKVRKSAADAAPSVTIAIFAGYLNS